MVIIYSHTHAHKLAYRYRTLLITTFRCQFLSICLGILPSLARLEQKQTNGEPDVLDLLFWRRSNKVWLLAKSENTTKYNNKMMTTIKMGIKITMIIMIIITTKSAQDTSTLTSWYSSLFQILSFFLLREWINKINKQLPKNAIWKVVKIYIKYVSFVYMYYFSIYVLFFWYMYYFLSPFLFFFFFCLSLYIYARIYIYFYIYLCIYIFYLLHRKFI